jgi:hypothetical protein
MAHMLLFSTMGFLLRTSVAGLFSYRLPFLQVCKSTFQSGIGFSLFSVGRDGSFK